MTIPAKPRAHIEDFSGYNRKQIVKEIESLRQSIGQTIIELGDSALATPNVVRKQTDITYLISMLDEISTRRIVFLTKVVAVFTVVLVALTIVLVYLTYELATRP